MLSIELLNSISDGFLAFKRFDCELISTEKKTNSVIKIINLILPEDKGKLCLKCKGENKNKPIEGLVILKDLILEDDTWDNGTILDPKSGKIYDCYISLEDDNTLKVRGFLGFSLLGRTQIWKRKLD